jgi:hypothetical protein
MYFPKHAGTCSGCELLRSAPCNTYCFLTNAVSSLLSDMQAQAEGLMAQVFLFRDRRC